MSGKRPGTGSTVSLDLTIPADRRYLDTVGALSARVAEQAGYPEGEARSIGATVERAAAGVIHYALGGAADRSIRIHYEIESSRIEIILHYPGLAGGELERGLRRGRSGDTELELMSRAVDAIEFGRADDQEFCRLTRKLPQPA
jgi:anti-sigma regulatory factor (Ser/Thr protein kinase)